MGIEGRNMYELAKELFPICRSITGEGVRETFQILKRQEEYLKFRQAYRSLIGKFQKNGI